MPPSRPLEEYDEFRPRKDWEGPPRGVVGQPVAVKAVLAHTDELAISVVGIAAFPTGVKFNILCLRRPLPPPADWRPPKPFEDPWYRRGGEDGFQLSVVFPDGRTSMRRGNWEPRSVPTAPVLVPSSGTTSYEKWSYSYWLWPLPPPGDLTFVCKWQAVGIPESRTIVGAAVIVEAAAQAIRLWPDDVALQSREKGQARLGTRLTGVRLASGLAQMEVSVREFSVRMQGYDFDHVVWLDEASGAFRFSTEDERPHGYASVFDGVRAATRLGRREPRLVRYEGSPAVVARLAGSLSVTAAFAVVRGDVVASTMTVTEVHDPEAAIDGRVFALPTGEERRVARQVDPITREAVGRGYWLGEQWDGAPPDFAAVSVAGDYGAVLVVYPGVSIITSAAEPGNELIGEPVTLAEGGVAGVTTTARTQPDGQFGTRWRQSDGSITGLGHYGNDLTLAGVGECAVEVVIGGDHIIITGQNLTPATIPPILGALRLI